MAEYIERSEAINKIFDQQITNDHLTELDSVFDIGLRRAMSEVANLPAADVAPVRHGHWIPHDDELGLTMECSACHVEGVIHGDYCPACGARMDEEV